MMVFAVARTASTDHLTKQHYHQDDDGGGDGDGLMMIPTPHHHTITIDMLHEAAKHILYLDVKKDMTFLSRNIARGNKQYYAMETMELERCGRMGMAMAMAMARGW